MGIQCGVVPINLEFPTTTTSFFFLLSISWLRYYGGPLSGLLFQLRFYRIMSHQYLMMELF